MNSVSWHGLKKSVALELSLKWKSLSKALSHSHLPVHTYRRLQPRYRAKNLKQQNVREFLLDCGVMWGLAARWSLLRGRISRWWIERLRILPNSARKPTALIFTTWRSVSWPSLEESAAHQFPVEWVLPWASGDYPVDFHNNISGTPIIPPVIVRALPLPTLSVAISFSFPWDLNLKSMELWLESPLRVTGPGVGG